MPYTPNPADDTQPIGTVDASTAAAEFRALKARVNAVAAIIMQWNSSDKDASILLTGGNLIATKNSADALDASVRTTFGKSGTGIWQWEITILAAASPVYLGVAKLTAALNNFIGFDANGYSYKSSNGNKANANVSAAYGAAFVAGDVIGFVLNTTLGTLTAYKNGVSQGVMYAGLVGAFYPTMSGSALNDSVLANFGALVFSYPVAGATAIGTGAGSGSSGGGAGSSYFNWLTFGGL